MNPAVPARDLKPPQILRTSTIPVQLSLGSMARSKLGILFPPTHEPGCRNFSTKSHGQNDQLTQCTRPATRFFEMPIYPTLIFHPKPSNPKPRKTTTDLPGSSLQQLGPSVEPPSHRAPPAASMDMEPEMSSTQMMSTGTRAVASQKRSNS